MINLLFALALLFSSIEGLWYGTIPAGAKQLRVSITIKASGDALTGTFNSLDQGSGELPLDDVKLVDGTLRFKLKLAGGDYEGKLDGDTIDGAWTQHGLSAPLKLARVDAIPTPPRPQEPKKPYPYAEEEVLVDHAKAGIHLGGTLTLPKTKPPFPAVVLVSGSGPQDRDETVFGHKPFLILADDLTRRGIAVLRVDDRGVGKSTGVRDKATTEDFAGDVAACVAFLKSRKDIDPKHIGLVGHSEGGMIAPMVATRSKDVAFIVLLAGPGVPGDELINLQQAAILRSMGASDAMVAEMNALQRKIIAVTKETPDETTLRAKLKALMTAEIAKSSDEAKPMFADVDAMIDSQIKRLSAPWYRWMLAYDPRSNLAKVRVPMLAVNGSKDVQVTPKENLAAIHAAAPNATIVELPGLNHLLQTAPTGSLLEYASIEETMAPAALNVVGEWIRKQTMNDER